MLDRMDRTPIADAVKRDMAAAFATIPDGKRAVLIAVATEDGAKVQVAAKLDDVWKVAAGGGYDWGGELHGSVMLVGEW